MAEAVVCFAVERFGELIISEAKFLYGVSDQIDEIRCELKRMQCFLNEADKKQSQDERVRNWVAEIKELAFKTEDVIETFALEVASKKDKTRWSLNEKLRRFACIVSEGVSLHKIGKEIKSIKGKLTSLSASLPRYGITKGLEEGESLNSMNLKNKRIFYSHDEERDFVGMVKEIGDLILHLKKEKGGCEVVSICGMGGQGKTTVARKVYNDANVQAHFQAFAWVCITQQYQREDVLKDILKELLPPDREGDVTSMNDAKLVKELYKVQQEKRCLIVIDDIWKIDDWRTLKPAFPVGNMASGSKILLTTRNVTVAEVGSVYRLPGLTEEEGWQLLSRKAFRGIDNVPEQMVASEMERIGRNMVKRCNGLPLAVSALGGILRGKLLREWEVINKDISFHLARGEADEYHTVTQVLGLSYDSLTPRLKHCFLCLGKYKEDEEIAAEELYLFWIAEGLIPMNYKAEGEMTLDVAERYLDELAHRSLVQVVPWDFEGKSWSKYRTCRVHDLVRDLCWAKVKAENFLHMIDLLQKPLLLDHNSKTSINRVRRLCIRFSGQPTPELLGKHLIPQIRSLLLNPNRFIRKWPDGIPTLHNFKLLRVLTLKNVVVTEGNLRSISRLVFLKYLSLKGTSMHDEVPSSIGNLRNLETLDLRVDYDIIIPNVLWKLKQLKYLYLPDTISGRNVEKLSFEGLDELEMIYNFHSVRCNTHDLIRLINIKVVTGIIRIEDKVSENLLSDFITKDMRHLKLTITGPTEISCFGLLLECSFIGQLRIFTPISVLPKANDHILFSQHLSRLELEHCRMREDPMILAEKLPNLTYLYLGQDSYIGTEMVCSARGFPRLQILYLFCLSELTTFRVDKGAMPNLSRLDINCCYNLEMLPDGLRFLRALTILDIRSMDSRFIDRARVINGVEGEDFHKVVHIPKLILS